MNKSDIFNDLSNFLKNDLNIDKEIFYESSLKNDLAIDSLEIIELVFFAETLIDKEIDLEEIESIEIVEDMVIFINQKIEIANKN